MLVCIAGALEASLGCGSREVGGEPSASAVASVAPAATTQTSTVRDVPSATADPSALPSPPMAGWHREMLGRTFAQPFPLHRVDEETKRFTNLDEAILTAQDFQLVLGQGSGRDGYVTLAIDGTGRTIFDFPARDGSFRRAELTLVKVEVDALRQELVDSSFTSLARGYYAQVDDGTQWFVRIRAGKARKGVFLDNHFPASVTRLAEYVRARIVEPRRSEIERATARRPGSGEPEFWPEDVPR